ncbi:MAG TPA: hypothetical protein VIM73_07960 [Polyangiaceae bacterium]
MTPNSWIYVRYSTVLSFAVLSASPLLAKEPAPAPLAPSSTVPPAGAQAGASASRGLTWNSNPGPALDTVAPPPAPKSNTNSLGGFLDFNAYPYLSEVKSDSVFTLNAAAKLPYGFSYFSLTNIMNQDGASPFQDTNGFYTEQNLRWSFPAPVPLDLTFQYNMRGGLDNDRWRFGFRWRADATPGLDAVMKAIAFSYSINFHVLQIDDDDGYVWQMEHVARLDTPYLDRRVYVAGFMDHTFNQGYDGIPENPIVLEVQGGLRAIDELYAIAEYRVNQYRVANESNLALGAEYVVKW